MTPPFCHYSLRRWLLIAMLAGIALTFVACDSQKESTDQSDGLSDTLADGDVDTSDGDTDEEDSRDTEEGDTVTDAGPDWEVTMFDVPPEECDDSLRPIVLAHGFLASGDTFANHVARFRNNGYCADQLHVFDWNTLAGAGDLDGQAELLDELVVEVLADSGAQQVDLAGHSAGGGLGYAYLSNSERAARVAHYAHIGSSVQDGPAGPEGETVPTLNLYSEDDLIISEKGDIPGATNVMLTGADHYEVATNTESFAAIYEFFTDEMPMTTALPDEDDVVLAGKALTLGENIPEGGATVEVWEVDPETGVRTTETPEAFFIVDEEGRWGPWAGPAGKSFEFRVNNGDTPVHYYREPQQASNRLIYLRTLPPPSSTAGLLLASVPFTSDQTVLVTFLASQGLLVGRDSLSVGDLELATEEFASAEQNAIAFFLYDDNGNDMTDGTGIDIFGSLPFLNGVDAWLSTAEPGTIQVEFNGRTLAVRNWPSSTEGAVIAVFD